jgi:hypothetical protein
MNMRRNTSLYTTCGQADIERGAGESPPLSWPIVSVNHSRTYVTASDLSFVIPLIAVVGASFALQRTGHSRTQWDSRRGFEPRGLKMNKVSRQVGRPAKWLTNLIMNGP